MKNKYMLRTKKDFDNLLKKKTSYNSSFCMVYIISNKIGHLRVGISVSKKIAKSSVLRNKARRQIKNILDYNIDFNKSADFLLIVKKEFFNKIFSEKERQLTDLLKKILVNY